MTFEPETMTESSSSRCALQFAGLMIGQRVPVIHWSDAGGLTIPNRIS